MLVTFQSPAYADITMFGDVAVQLLKLLGHSGTVPSAIMAEDLPAALERLRKSLAEIEKKESQQQDKNAKGQENRVSLAHRALPLIELLEAAIAADADVMWDK